jgi:hypothetical protein
MSNINYSELYSVCARLTKDYPSEANLIKSTIDSLKNDESVTNAKTVADKLQEINNKLYEKYGDKDDIIIFQARINQIRHEYNIVDPSEIIHRFDDGAFVQ